MATPWDRPTREYVAEWVPRFFPYLRDLVCELALDDGERVLVPCCGTGAEVVAVAREVGPANVRATELDQALADVARLGLDAAGFPSVRLSVSPAEDVSGGSWDAVVCAFGLWQLDHRVDVLRAWRGALAPKGKVGVLTWGPPEENDPFERMMRCLAEREPAYALVPPRIHSGRDSMESMFEEAGLTLARHTVLRHTLSFPSAEAFVTALRCARGFDRAFAELGEARLGLVLARFYEEVGGPAAPLPWDPPATLAIAANPGTEVTLLSRSSMRVGKPA